MPYITKEDRTVIDHLIGKDFSPQNGGELQYAIAELIQRYLRIVVTTNHVINTWK